MNNEIQSQIIILIVVILIKHFEFEETLIASYLTEQEEEEEENSNFFFCHTFLTDHLNPSVFLFGSIRHLTEILTDDLKHFGLNNPSN